MKLESKGTGQDSTLDFKMSSHGLGQAEYKQHWAARLVELLTLMLRGTSTREMIAKLHALHHGLKGMYFDSTA